MRVTFELRKVNLLPNIYVTLIREYDVHGLMITELVTSHTTRNKAIEEIEKFLHSDKYFKI